jgi:hypothetical protein
MGRAGSQLAWTNMKSAISKYCWKLRMNRMCSFRMTSGPGRIADEYDRTVCSPPNLSQYLNADRESRAFISISSWFPSNAKRWHRPPGR